MARTKLLAIPVVLLLGIALWRSALAASPGAAAPSGKVSVVRAAAKSVRIIVRTASHKVVILNLGSPARVTTADNHAMQASSIQLGDHVTMSVHNTLHDTSQRLMQLNGIVSFAPGGTTGSMAVHTAKDGDVAVSLDPATKYADTTHQTQNLSEVEEADQVRMLGIVDVALGEMTQTINVTRLGPVNRKTPTQGGTHG